MWGVFRPFLNYPRHGGLLLITFSSMRNSTAVLCVFAALVTQVPRSASAQVAVGSIRGSVKLRVQGIIDGPQDSLVVILREITTDHALQQVRPRADGHFLLHGVPFAAYRVEAWQGKSMLASTELAVNTALPIEVALVDGESAVAEGAVTLPEKAVSARKRESPLETANHNFLAAEDIRGLMISSREKAAEAVLLQSADVVPDEDGRMHARGEDAAIQYVVDGIPLSGNPTRIYSSLFSADMAKSIDVRIGGLPAQYAGGSAAVSVTTQDGLDHPFALKLGAGAGSFGNREAQVQGSGRLGERTALVVNFAGSRTDRFLDPISGFEPLNDAGDGRHVFAKVTSLPGDDMEFHLLGAYDATGFHIPNLREGRSPAQNQAQDLDSYLLGARLNVNLGEGTRLGIAAHSRRNQARLTSGGLERIATPADSEKALRENERFFLGAHRENGYHGGLVELSHNRSIRGREHRLRAGISGEVNPLEESFAFAVTDSSLTGSGGDARLKPFDLQRGGAPLEARESRTGWAASMYLEDGFEVGKWSFAPGLRFDAFEMFAVEASVSPRFAAAYAWNPKLDLRGSLDYLVTRAPLENILLSSSPDMRPLSGDEQGSTSTEVGSESAVVLGLGANWRPHPLVVLDLDTYGKYLRDFLVKAELGNSGLIFPINLKSGVVAGGVLKASLREWNRVSGSLSVGSCVSIGLKPEDGSSPIRAGLLVGEEGHNYGHPWAKEEFFPTEHNQIATAVLNLKYRLYRGVSGMAGGRFDSGLPFDMIGPDGNGLDADATRAELQRRGYSKDVIDLLNLESEEPGSPDKSVAPHAVFDLGLEYVLPLSRLSLEARAAVLNVLDTPYLYKFESSFGSTHFGQPRTLGVWLALGY